MGCEGSFLARNYQILGCEWWLLYLIYNNPSCTSHFWGGTSHFGCLFPLNYIGTRECMGWNEMGLEQCMINADEKYVIFVGEENHYLLAL